MEWVEVTAKTIEEAKEEALDQLGVDETEAEFEVLEEPKAGLFGRVRAEARVRARVQPTAVRPKVERGSRRRGRKDRPEDVGRPAEVEVPPGETGVPAVASQVSTGPEVRSPAPSRPGRPKRAPKSAAERKEPMHESDPQSQGEAGEVGEEFLQGLIVAFGVTATVAVHELDEGDMVELTVDGDDVGMLIGPRGQTLAALQELTRTVVQRKAESHQRVIVDVGGYSKARREALARFTQDVAAEVVSSGVARVLEPMPPADRKVVHDTVNGIDGVSTTSEGEEPRRRVVVSPDEAGA